MANHINKKTRRGKKKQYAKRCRNRFGGCIIGGGKIITCSFCLGPTRVGRTKLATALYDRSNK